MALIISHLFLVFDNVDGFEKCWFVEVLSVGNSSMFSHNQNAVMGFKGGVCRGGLSSLCIPSTWLTNGNVDLGHLVKVTRVRFLHSQGPPHLPSSTVVFARKLMYAALSIAVELQWEAVRLQLSGSLTN